MVGLSNPILGERADERQLAIRVSLCRRVRLLSLSCRTTAYETLPKGDGAGGTMGFDRPVTISGFVCYSSTRGMLGVTSGSIGLDIAIG